MNKRFAEKKEIERDLAVWCLLFGMIGSVFFLTKTIAERMVYIAGFCLFFEIYYIQKRHYTKYCQELVKCLDALLDQLLCTKKERIFPENQDTLVSKLQHKVFRFAHILQQQKEQERKEQEKIKSLISDLSHQIKTPIANLKMYEELLREPLLSQEERIAYQDILRETIGRMQFLTEQLFRMSRLEGGLIKLDLQKQSLSTTLLHAIKGMYAKAEEKQMEIVFEEERDIDLLHDKKWLSEAVGNLLDNAVKYGEQGQQIVLRVKPYGMFVEIQVVDENVPIDSEEQNKIFQRFYRGKKTRDKEGIGIGLYLAKEIVEKQGGYMRLLVKETGNCFSIVLPMENGLKNVC